jgi:hypothetical protein
MRKTGPGSSGTRAMRSSSRDPGRPPQPWGKTRCADAGRRATGRGRAAIEDDGMSPVPVDPAAIRAGLERQLALLTPVVEHLQSAAADANPLISDEWHGPAAEAAATFLLDLRAGLRAAADEADDVVRILRFNIATLS